MAMVSITSNLTPNLSFEGNNSHLRDASFSSYLNSSEEAFVRKLAQTSPVMSSKEKEDYLTRKKEEDGEIGVFGAEKYFNGVMDDSPRVPKLSRKSNRFVKDRKQMEVVIPVKPNIRSGTPSVRSESSWNSQSALLQSSLRNLSRVKDQKVQKKNFLSGFRCKCTCSDKDSVEIDENVGETSFKRSSNNGLVQSNVIVKIEEPGSVRKDDGLIRENIFSFPTTNSAAVDLPVKMNFNKEHKEENPRKSLEVFGCPVLDRRDRSFSLERRFALPSWDANPMVEELKFSPTLENYNDTESDASSDLFEIESLTGKGNPFLARQGSDAASDYTPTPYAPSEASIEWSVVTASAADFSIMSDTEDVRPVQTTTGPFKVFTAASNAKNRTTAEVPKRRPSISLGCKSQKAVRVAGDVHKTNVKASYDLRMQRMSDSFTPMTRSRAEPKLTGFDSRQRQHPLTAIRSLPRSHSPHPSHLLYIQ